MNYCTTGIKKEAPERRSFLVEENNSPGLRAGLRKEYDMEMFLAKDREMEKPWATVVPRRQLFQGFSRVLLQQVLHKLKIYGVKET